MMEIEAGLCVLLRQGPYYDSSEFCLNLGRSEHAQPTLPQYTFIHTHPACIYNVPDSNGLAGEQMDLQVYTNRIYRINEKGR